MRAKWRLLPAIVWVACAPSSGRAQLSATLDAGWASIHYEEYLRSSVVTVTPALRLEYARSTVVLRGTYSRFESGSRSADAVLAASTFSKPMGSLRAEVSAGGGGTVYNGLGSGHLSGAIRLHSIGRAKGAWVGGGAGFVDDGVLGARVTRIGAGGWARLNGLGVSLSANHLVAPDVAVTDIDASTSYTRGAVEFSANAGLRMGSRDLIGAKRWADLTGVFWLGRHVAVVAAHGRYPSEPSRGTPGGNYSSFSIRLASRAPVVETATTRTLRSEPPAIARPVVQAFELKNFDADRDDSLRILVVRAPGARRVELAGDFTEWRAVEMPREINGENFVLRVKVPPGSHKFNVRVDAGEWGVPPGVPLVRDEFGDAVALLIIRAR